jgi:RNA polymerase sigma-70 factor (ECF subfamily)
MTERSHWAADVATPSDPDLADVRAAQVDRQAFATLYRRYLEPVYGYAFYLLGDHHDAEDVTERTFVSALAAIGRFRDTGSTFRSWLFRIAHNELANALRSRRRQRVTSIDAVPEPADAVDPADRVSGREESRRLRGALQRLAPDRRQVVVLRVIDGLSARETGEVIGRSEGAVRVLQHRALREMAAHLRERD